MSPEQELIAHYAEVRGRLWNPPKVIVTQEVIPAWMPAMFVMVGRLIELREQNKSNRIPVRKIIDVVAKRWRLTREDIISQRKTNDVVIPRHVAIYLAKKLTTRSTTDIGRIFGGRDHSTVINAIKNITRRIESDPVLAYEIEKLKLRLA